MSKSNSTQDEHEEQQTCPLCMEAFEEDENKNILVWYYYLY